jgi:DNA-binding MarR family transcriptional regulator
VAQSDVRYDVFISHASEDKDSFARPLAQALVNLGLKVWFDEFTLQIGDKLRESIDGGLGKSDFGVIILSKNFFSKNWPKMELEGLTTLSMKNETRLLPIWHGVSSDDVVKFSPMIATLYALGSSLGVNTIASKIQRVVTHKQIDSYEIVQSESPFKLDEIDQSSVGEIQNKRFRFLLNLYEKRDRQMIKNDQYQIGEELGFDKEYVNQVTKYLTDKGYIEYPIIGNFVQITDYGIDYLELLIPNSAEVQKTQSNRIAVLKELYLNKEGYWGINMWDIKNKLNFADDSTMLDIVFHLNYRGLISTHGPLIKITTEGIDFIEQYLS